jgi:hypothetical protein
VSPDVAVDGQAGMLYNGDAFGKAGFGVARLLGARGGGA